MSAFKTFPNFAANSTEDELYQSATALQLVTSLQPVPPHALPLNPHIGEFSELTYVLVCERRQGRA